jgi:hypothetical protein
MAKTRDYADTDAVAQVLEQVIKHIGKIIKRSKTINGDHLQKLCGLTNSYTRLLLTETEPQPGEYEAMLGEFEQERNNSRNDADNDSAAEVDEEYLKER